MNLWAGADMPAAAVTALRRSAALPNIVQGRSTVHGDGVFAGEPIAKKARHRCHILTRSVEPSGSGGTIERGTDAAGPITQ